MYRTAIVPRDGYEHAEAAAERRGAEAAAAIVEHSRSRLAGLEEIGVRADYDVIHDRDPAAAVTRFADALPASLAAFVHRAACPVLVSSPRWSEPPSRSR